MSIGECKRILGRVAEKMTDPEIESLRDTFIVLSDLVIDSYLTKRKSILNEQKYGNGISKS